MEKLTQGEGKMDEGEHVDCKTDHEVVRLGVLWSNVLEKGRDYHNSEWSYEAHEHDARPSPSLSMAEP
jgi:hypothetical protein